MKSSTSLISLSAWLWIATPVCRQVRNVIFTIGDGMGLTQIQAAYYTHNQSRNNTLHKEYLRSLMGLKKHITK